MGYLPISLALLFVLLLIISLVNRASIRRYRQIINFALFSACQTAQSRHKLLKRNKQFIVNQQCSFSDNPEKPNFFTTGDLQEFLLSENKSLQQTAYQLEQSDRLSRSQKSLLVLNHRQRINLRILERKIREYNQLISRQPTSMVARISGHRPIALPAAAE